MVPWAIKIASCCTASILQATADAADNKVLTKEVAEKRALEAKNIYTIIKAPEAAWVVGLA